MQNKASLRKYFLVSSSRGLTVAQKVVGWRPGPPASFNPFMLYTVASFHAKLTFTYQLSRLFLDCMALKKLIKPLFDSMMCSSSSFIQSFCQFPTLLKTLNQSENNKSMRGEARAQVDGFYRLQTTVDSEISRREFDG